MSLDWNNEVCLPGDVTGCWPGDLEMNRVGNSIHLPANDTGKVAANKKLEKGSSGNLNAIKREGLRVHTLPKKRSKGGEGGG